MTTPKGTVRLIHGVSEDLLHPRAKRMLTGNVY